MATKVLALNQKSNSLTDSSLLERLRDSRYRTDAWAEFVNRYTRLFFHWFQRWGVSIDDKDDLLQESIIRVFRDLKHFDRKRQGSFRSWLKSLAHHSWRQIVEDTERQLAERKACPVRLETWGLLNSKIAEDQLLELFDAWATQELIQLACANVRRRVSPETWRTYAALTFERRSVEDVKTTLGLPTDLIYNRIFRVRRMIREEMDLIDV